MGSLSRRQFLLGLPVAGAALAVAGRESKARPQLLESLPFQAGTMGYVCFRTPGLAIAANGTVLAFCGGRLENCKDDGDHDVVLRRSTDGGRSWGPLQIIANDSMNRCDIPVPVVLGNGRILLLWVWNAFVRRKEDRGERRVRICVSDDHGLTWSSPRDITEQVRLPGWTSWYGLGPGHGFVKQLAPAAGRIIVPARHSQASHGTRSHLIYSDDGGLSWQVGAISKMRGSESTACEIGNGTILLNSRTTKGYRLVTVCTDGGKQAASSALNRQLIEPANGCQGSLLTYSLTAASRSAQVLFSNPSSSRNRTNGRIRLSRDGGLTWSQGFPYQRGPEAFTGYSDLARFANGDVAVLFESGASFRRGPQAEWSSTGLDPRLSATGKAGRAGRPDRRYDGIGFTRVPFQLIANQR